VKPDDAGAAASAMLLARPKLSRFAPSRDPGPPQDDRERVMPHLRYLNSLDGAGPRRSRGLTSERDRAGASSRRVTRAPGAVPAGSNPDLE
jgi:hypothetical protein